MLKNKKNITKSIITYKDSGVDIDAGNKLIPNISKITEKPLIRKKILTF